MINKAEYLRNNTQILSDFKACLQTVRLNGFLDRHSQFFHCRRQKFFVVVSDTQPNAVFEPLCTL